MTFPLDQVNERTLEPHFSGEVFVCDIDRTYLYTRFSSLSGISRIPFEFAIDKQDIEGMTPLLREVRRGPARMSRHTPLYFVSASPAQMRKVIERKMLLDGLEHDGTIFKDWLGVLRGLRLHRFREQLGFKLTALLQLRRQLPEKAVLVLMGDDLETDPLAFALMADILDDRIEESRLGEILQGRGVLPGDAREILRLSRGMPGSGGVRRALIRLERHHEPLDFIDYFPRLVVCRDALQMAVVLLAQGSLAEEGVARVASSMRSRGRTPDQIDDRLRECTRRCLIDLEPAGALRQVLAQAGLTRPDGPLPDPEERWVRAAHRMAGSPVTPGNLSSAGSPATRPRKGMA